MKERASTAVRCAFVAALAAVAGGCNAEDCTRIADKTKRLECFDKEAAAKQAPASTNTEEAKIQEAVRLSLKDPGSAQFGRLTLITPTKACQTVNARNVYGGYTGDQQAIVMKMEKLGWVSIAIHQIPHSQCISVAKELKD